MSTPSTALQKSEGTRDNASAGRCCAAVLYHIADVFGDALLLMKRPASVLLALLISGSVAAFVLSTAFAQVRTGIALINYCHWPFLSALDVCAPLGPSKVPPRATEHVDFPGLVAVQHHALDELVRYSDNGSALAVNLKHAELAVQDLVILVKASNLTIKDVLADALTEFVVDAKSAARHLQVLSSKINGAMDNIVAYNQYALRVLGSASETTRSGLEATVSRTFQSSMDAFAADVTRVLVFATTTAVSLDRLEERLLTVHTLCTEEAIMTALAMDDLLWQLWTQLGGNKKQRRDLEHRAAVLKSIQQYRSLAMAYVAATAQTLTAVDVELSELRERLSSSGLLPESAPIEVQLSSIQRSVMRLQEVNSHRGRLSGLVDGSDGQPTIDA